METEKQAGPLPGVQLDSRKIRVLAHPLRMRLLVALRTDGPATATTLAQALETNTGATSYHLRQLAEVGLVVEEPDRGAGRQRWWRAEHEVSSWQATDFDHDPDARAASEWIQGFQLRYLAEQAERWRAVEAERPRAWREATDFSDALLTLTPERLRALNDELWAVVERYRQETPPPEELDARPDVEQVLVFLAGFPRVRP